MEEYFESGQIKYKGEYKNGKRNGNGIEYKSNGSLSYEGEFKDGKEMVKVQYMDMIIIFLMVLYMKENF